MKIFTLNIAEQILLAISVSQLLIILQSRLLSQSVAVLFSQNIENCFSLRSDDSNQFLSGAEHPKLEHLSSFNYTNFAKIYSTRVPRTKRLKYLELNPARTKLKYKISDRTGSGQKQFRKSQTDRFSGLAVRRSLDPIIRFEFTMIGIFPCVIFRYQMSGW